MASSSDAAKVISMPMPPDQFIKHYTDDNIKENKAPKAPAVQNEYEMFGVTSNSSDPMVKLLDDYEVTRLYPENCNGKSELKKINVSIVMNFMDLLDLMIKCPESKLQTKQQSHNGVNGDSKEDEKLMELRTREKINDLTVLFINMNHLINEKRIHQSRETLTSMMLIQLRKRREMISMMQKAIESARQCQEEAYKSIPEIVMQPEICHFPMDVDNFTKAIELSSTSARDQFVDPIDKVMCRIVDDDDFALFWIC